MNHSITPKQRLALSLERARLQDEARIAASYMRQTPGLLRSDALKLAAKHLDRERDHEARMLADGWPADMPRLRR